MPAPCPRHARAMPASCSPKQGRVALRARRRGCQWKGAKKKTTGHLMVASVCFQAGIRAESAASFGKLR
eukprot:gene18295-biopygen17392